MICKLKPKGIEELNATNILPQTPFWGRIKKDQGFIPTAFELTVSRNLLQGDAESLSKEALSTFILKKKIIINKIEGKQ